MKTNLIEGILNDSPNRDLLIEQLIKSDTYERYYKHVKRYGIKAVNEIFECILSHYSTLSEWKFGDYANALALVFLFGQNFDIENDLYKFTYIDKYNYIIRKGLTYAGEFGERGNDYKGGDAIRRYSKYLNKSILIHILSNPEIIVSVDIRYKLQLIIFSQFSDQIKQELINKYVLTDIILHRSSTYFTNYFGAKYPDAVFQHCTDESLIMNLVDKGMCYQVKINCDLSDIYIFVKEGNRNTKITIRGDRKKYKFIIGDNNAIETYLSNISIKGVMNKKWSSINDAYVISVIRQFIDKLFEIYDIALSNENTYREMLKLIFIYIKSMNQKKYDKLISLSDEYIINEDKDNNILYIDIKDSEKNKCTDFYTINDDMFNEEETRIRGINAIIGKNGSGKTSFTNLLLYSDIFGKIESENNLNYMYCMCYKIGKNFYYINNTGELIKVRYHNEPIQLVENLESKMYKNTLNTSVILYNNIFSNLCIENVKCNSKSKERYDISTQNIYENDIKDKKHRDIFNIINLYADDFPCDKYNVVTLPYLKDVTLNEINYNIKYNIVDLSSGQAARLLLFARLHSIFHVNDNLVNYMNPISENRNFIIILDEVEAFFHPTWQREIVYDLISFFQWELHNFDAFDNLQLFLSSNSPFFLSDLPASDIIYLDSDAREKNTFGQNIHTILKENFLLENGLMGKFAQEKIQKAFKLLDEKYDSSDKDKMYTEYIINIVDDTIIKHALLDLYDKKYARINEKTKQKEIYERQIRELQMKIEELD